MINVSKAFVFRVLLGITLAALYIRASAPVGWFDSVIGILIFIFVVFALPRFRIE